MRRGIPRSWSVAIVCSLALSLAAPFYLDALNVAGAKPGAAAQEPAPEPATEPTPEPATEPTPEPATEPAPEPATKPATKPATELPTTPAAEPAREQAPGPESELDTLAPAEGVRAPSIADDLGAELDDAASESAGEGGRKESFLKWLYKSLKFRYVLIFLILTFNSVALIVMIVLGMRRNSLCPDDLAAAFEALLNQKQYQDAYELAKSDKSFLGKVLAGGMSKVAEGHTAVQEAMQEVGEEQNMKLEQRNGYIALIAQIGPMFGLLGTVDGMVIAFDTIATKAVTPKPSELAVGIGTALVTTIVGLWIAIPLMIFYHIIRNRLARTVLEISVVATNLMKRFETVTATIKKT
ncbi:MAG: MotA/TolQ/ExbB proton channel family protein [Pirellulaceae bacterium]|nr:MotA/TolQ/ExbB proton channel family protein [Pirellulaceae bacterium]